MIVTWELVAVAFVRSVGGHVRLLLVVACDGTDLYDGEPALLVEHRPGTDPDAVYVEGADVVPAALVALVHARAREPLARLVEGAFDDAGEFDGQRLVGRAITFAAPRIDAAG